VAPEENGNQATGGNDSVLNTILTIVGSSVGALIVAGAGWLLLHRDRNQASKSETYAAPSQVAMDIQRPVDFQKPLTLQATPMR